MSSTSPDQTETKPVGHLRALSRLVPFLRPVLPRLLWGTFAALLSALLSLATPIAMRALVDGPLAAGDAAAVWPVGIAILALGLGEAFFVYMRRLLVTLPSTKVEASMRRTLYAKLQALPVAFHDRWQSGQLLSRAVQDLGMIRRFTAFGAPLLVVNSITLVVGIGVLFYWSPLLAGVFVTLSAPIVLVALRFERRYFSISRSAQDQAGDLATTVEQSIHGIRVLKAFGRGRHALEGFTDQAKRLRETEIDKARMDGSLWMWLTIVPYVSYAVCLFLGVWLAASGQITVGTLFAFFAVAMVLNWPIESIGFLFAFLIDASNASRRFHEILDSENTIVDPAEPKTIREPKGRLVFEGVHFRYQDAQPHERDLVDGADLVIEPGETMALIGITGSGKTTLTALPTRLYDVTGGRVLLDGVDVRELTLEELRTHVAMAFEDATLFSASVRDNVLMGAPDASEEALDRALSIAQADFARNLPKGLDTEIGEEGLSLSGGQRQRLALARAVAADPAVLVLDDPLSALDVETEAQVEDALRHVLERTTALIVAHRPSTVQLADRVALMRDGRIVDVGTHSELLARSEHYRYVISSLEEAERDRQSIAAVTGAMDVIDIDALDAESSQGVSR
ncbi:ABC transporter ATP-binding protein [Agrococcus sp. Marseille-Q4369]|uniref:ABC transporter ATP-binding protein n=1 Tax=Agrococcus sp. Marseille-Q4369 TaxID=2810513 RepID=UPI001B8C31B6|nr:ABC transporter ATP-binding protein [Agrococcus sp. Marseille-Q4369]QUW19935.1 ABC transporter ATP-binding protein [Agrococcus sp. Marseille-Q4369]